MEILFYLFNIISIISAIGVVLNTYPVYALLCLVVSCLSISCVFFLLGAYLAGALEVIIYAGAIMVLFIFVVMMLNVDDSELKSNSLMIERSMSRLFLIFIFSVISLYIIWSGKGDFYIDNISREIITLKSVGISLFGYYLLVVEMASMLLLAALIISLRIGGGFSELVGEGVTKDNTTIQ
ncbi:NADH-quinone oxidoreductase subunit J [Blochmannia endosymbiont of Polyrhachis (Hedomyrma) turneri]|uniref:NADH-quinone oxidoreductase subunit J n=1 Tax=Blochmannia endosymbiont of Polyrhachis (Hedomyrma) turneri TaxID=1505596 RepID=UPI00061A6DC0|nr:NADH-quinone oxidoreductase subunit J [Blochmannia endosymbiont of Polyrhachis (Hedomyrma) turneri]AKC60047.1 NADH-quinone oxidoreductase subunit J [Blochmannia endosymbiont of Polyrhachis (Hedomyrma) turneri]